MQRFSHHIGKLEFCGYSLHFQFTFTNSLSNIKVSVFAQHFKSWLMQRFSHNIGKLEFCGYSLHFQFTFTNSLLNIKVSDTNVLCTAMEFRVLCQLQSCFIIDMQNWCSIVSINLRSQTIPRAASLAATISDSVVEIATDGCFWLSHDTAAPA